MFYPVFTVFREKGKHTYTRKELRNTAVINSVIIQIVVIFLTYPTVPTFMPPLFYGYINYRLLKKYLLQNEHSVTAEAVSDIPSEPEPQPVPEALPEQPVQLERVKVKAIKVKPTGKPAQPPRSDPQPAPKPEHPARPPDNETSLKFPFFKFLAIGYIFIIGLSFIIPQYVKMGEMTVMLLVYTMGLLILNFYLK